MLGFCFYDGKGVAQNSPEAFKWLEECAAFEDDEEEGRSAKPAVSFLKAMAEARKKPVSIR